MKVRKVVIVAAGRGTRFLPITKSLPKEMLPLIDKPTVQYVIEEALGSGISQVIVITSQGKTTMEDYFDRSLELEYFLDKKGDDTHLSQVRELSRMVNVCYVRQKEQLGLGHAILTARDVVGDEPFAVVLPDDIIDSHVPTLKSMIDIYEQYESGVVAVERVPDEAVKKYGIIEPVQVSERVYQVLNMVEKPDLENAPSRLGIVGRYILPSRIFDIIAATPPGKGNEIQITDAMQALLKEQKFYAYELEGIRHDTGTPLGWLKANIALALKDPDIGPELKGYLQGLS